jgi:hypothetical protein
MKTYLKNLWFALVNKPDRVQPLGGGGGPKRPL